MGSLRASEVGSIEVMPQVLKGMWPENMKNSFLFCFKNHRTIIALCLSSKANWNHHMKQKNENFHRKNMMTILHTRLFHTKRITLT
jgi:hypothetical protein